MQHPYDDLFYDLEFLENGYRIDLISIGMVGRDGKKYYAINANMDEAGVMHHLWLRKNVIPHLPRHPGVRLDGTGWLGRTHPDVKSRNQISDEVSEFIGSYANPRLVGYYSDYDHVGLMQLWGPMVAKPAHVPMRTFDLAQLAEELGNPKLPAQTTPEHHALNDAMWNMEAYDFLQELRREAYVDTDDGEPWLTHSECEMPMIALVEGVTLRGINEAYARHLNPEIPLGWEEAEAA